MNYNLKPYPAYKESGLPWVGQIPVHWEVRRQRNIVDLRVSNVDKRSNDGETAVRLCNYVDVYKNDRITERLPFMRATAATEEVNRFRLRLGDVLITKDSESWNDIGVPSLVDYAAPDLLCGYHLALLRPLEGLLHGPYLFRALQSPTTAYQYNISANGITRYGLSQDAIKSVFVPLPPLAEQYAVARFLDYVDRRISRYIRAKKKLIVLLNEQKQAIIQRAVARGLNPNVTLRASGVEWLGDIPKHWSTRRAKQLFREVDHRSSTGTEVLLSLRMHVGLVPHNNVSEVTILPSALAGFKRVVPGQIVMNRMRAAMGLFGLATQPGIVSPDYAVLEPIGQMDPEYAILLFKTPAAGALFRAESKGLGTGASGFMRLYTDRFGSIKLPNPPLEEQQSIVQWLSTKTARTHELIERFTREINLHDEYRTRLIADVVTGKLDVREAASRLPEEEPVEVDEAQALEEDDEGEGAGFEDSEEAVA